MGDAGWRRRSPWLISDPPAQAGRHRAPGQRRAGLGGRGQRQDPGPHRAADGLSGDPDTRSISTASWSSPSPGPPPASCAAGSWRSWPRPWPRTPATAVCAGRAPCCRRAQIGTIHSFCATLLRENSHALSLSPDFKILDEERAERMKAAALERVLEALLRRAGGAPRLSACWPIPWARAGTTAAWRAGAQPPQPHAVPRPARALGGGTDRAAGRPVFRRGRDPLGPRAALRAAEPPDYWAARWTGCSAP